MKKNTYTSPTVDLSTVEVEMGIAVSDQTLDTTFADIYLTEEEVIW